MSRVGKEPIKVEGVQISISDKESRFRGQLVNVKGNKGELSVHVRPEIKVDTADGEVIVQPASKRLSKEVKGYYGLYRTLIANAVEGVTNGFSKELEIVGIGYKVEQAGQVLKFKLGFNNTIDYQLPEGITVEIKDGVEIKISGIDKQLVGEVAAQIRELKKPEPYKGKGVRYKDEYVKIKAGKSAA